MVDTEIVLQGLYFGEGPRWHNNRLWFSDFYDHAVMSLGMDGDLVTEFTLQDQPSGLGWLPDGRLLVVAMTQRQLLCQQADGSLALHADLSNLASFHCNDMVVSADGTAWVGNFGFDLDAAMAGGDAEAVLANHPTANLMKISLDGTATIASPDMHFPNGSVITPDGKTMIVAETLAMCLTAFDITSTGELINRRVWAELGICAPDGICLNTDGDIWLANALAAECWLVREGGEVVQTVHTSQNCFACALGGPDGKDLYAVTAVSSHRDEAAAARTGKIERVAVKVAAAN
jgi:sugar lactone lactonase YvrE